MKKMLTLLTVTIIAANLSGCCCRRLCPFLDRGAYCGSPAPIYAPLAATAPAYQYASPLAATSPGCCNPQPCCTAWDPCQGVVTYGYGGGGGACQGGCATGACPTACPAPACQSCPSPCGMVEPSCGYMEPSCGYMGGVSYGPMMGSGCSTCNAGGYSGTMVGPSAPEIVMPGPTE